MLIEFFHEPILIVDLFLYRCVLKWNHDNFNNTSSLSLTTVEPAVPIVLAARDKATPCAHTSAPMARTMIFYNLDNYLSAQW